MRIGIYTQPLRYNYGGLLQAWALQMVLRRMGHDVVTFNPDQYEHLSWMQKPFVYANRITQRILGHPIEIRREVRKNREHDIKMQNLKSFIDSNIQTKVFRDANELSSRDYDVLITGSDQVWRPQYNETFGRTIENAFLEFAQHWKVRRIAYAASFGTDEWEFTEEQTARCSNLVRKFQAVSVREQSAIRMCKDYLGVQAVQTLDPTFLLHCTDYDALIKNGLPTKIPTGNLLYCILDSTEEKDMLIKHIAQSKGLTPFRGQSKIYDKFAGLEERIQPSVEQWLRNFKEASFVVTDSFHACVFSIIFRKPFVVIGNEDRGMARYKSLFEMLMLENHLLYHANDYDSSISYEVDEKVMVKLDTLRATSMTFLTNALK